MERQEKYMQIIHRAVSENLFPFDGDKLSLLMDIESADKKFNLRLDEWLSAGKFDFAHDLYGIMDNIVRDSYPATDFGLFVPRFASPVNAEKMAYKVPVVWEMMGYVTVLAESPEAATKHVSENPDLFPLPENGEYLEDSFGVDEEGEPIPIYS